MIYKKILSTILKGGSRLKEPLSSGRITLGQIITAIHRERCLNAGEFDLGSTYMEQIIGNAIRDSIPQKWINYARRLFGLDEFSPRRLDRQPKQSASEPGNATT